MLPWGASPSWAQGHSQQQVSNGDMVGRGISFIRSDPAYGTTWLTEQFSPWVPTFPCLQKVPMWVSRQGLALLNRRQIVLPDPSRATWWGHGKSCWTMVTQLGKVTCKGNTKRLCPYLLLQGGRGVLFYRFVSSAPVSSHTGNIVLCFHAGSPFLD